MHWEWNAWRHAGRRRSSSCGWKGLRQTEQSGEDLGRTEREDARENSGSASTSAALSLSENPESAVEEGEPDRLGSGSGGGGGGGAAATDELRRREERRRRRRWMKAEAMKTKAIMAEMIKRLGLRDKEAELLVASGKASSAGGRCLRGRCEGGADGGGRGIVEREAIASRLIWFASLLLSALYISDNFQNAL